MSEARSDRGGRQRCWEARDKYFACLTEQEALAPESERLKVQERLRGDPNSPCGKLREEFEKLCLPSWSVHFEKQREAQLKKAAFDEFVRKQNEEIARRAFIRDSQPQSQGASDPK
eukprot:tig00000955_g5795.t1